MKIYTNKNNTSTLKLLIAAKLAGKKLEIIDTNFEGIFFLFYLFFYYFIHILHYFKFPYQKSCCY